MLSKTQDSKPSRFVEIALRPVKVIFFVFRTFFAFSSLHGFNHLTAKGRHPAEKLLWVTALSLALWGAFTLSWETWRRFQDNPTVVSMERNYQEWNTSFPSISVCPKIKYNEKNIRRTVEEFEYVTDKRSLIRFLKELGNATFGSFNAVTSDLPQLEKSHYWRAVTRMAFPFDYKVSNTYPDVYPVFKMNPFISELGICYSYNSGATYYNDPAYWEQDRWTNLGEFPIFQTSPLDGDVFVQLRYINSPYELFILSPFEFPDIALPRVDGAYSTYTSVDLTALSIVSSKATELLSVQQRRCRLQQESELITSPVYSYNLCRMECRMRMCHELCGCVPFFYRPTGKFPVCDLNGMQCLQNYTDVLQRLLHPETKKRRDCGCLPLCHEVHYFVDSMNSVQWSIGTNLKIGLSKYPKFRLKRDILFGQIDLLVAIGGTAGLFLGCSILSLIEVLYYFVLRLFLYVSYRKPLKYA